MAGTSGCCAFGCTNRPDFKVPGITFHVFPKDLKRRIAWIKAIREKNFRPDFQLGQFTKICSEHFDEQCFDRTKKRVFLHPHAVPSIFESSPHSQPNARQVNPPTKVYANGVMKRSLSESEEEDEDDIIFNKPIDEDEEEDEYIDEEDEEDSSSSDSSLEESDPEGAPETEVVYVSEEASEANKPSIIKIVPEKPQPAVAIHKDITKALEAYSKLKKTSTEGNGEGSHGDEVSLVVLQPPRSPTDANPPVLTPLQLVEFSPKVLNEMYERNKKELKTMRQKSRRYQAKIARLEKVVSNFKKCGSSEDEEEEEDEQIEVDKVYEQLLKKQESEEEESEEASRGSFDESELENEES